MAATEFGQNLSVDDIDLMLVKRRRFRPPKACYPCRRRKVKCNFSSPCGSCEKRGHPDLCDYTLQASGNSDSTGVAGNTRRSQYPSGSSDDATSTAKMIEGLYVDSHFPYGSKVHLGSDSLPKFLSAFQRLNSRRPQAPSPHSILDSSPNHQTIFELVCLQDSSSYFPFTNLWRPEDGPEEVYSALPEDEVLLAYYRFCQASLFRILPSTINFLEFEDTLWQFLNERGKLGKPALLRPPPGCTPSWFALLFGILACGIQLGSSENESEILQARVFACCSFQCLRMSNFLSYPNVQVIQALILLVNFLRNQADAGASWSILGLTIRLAQSLGMHCVPDQNLIDDLTKRDEAIVKRYIWRSLIWQDTLVSLCYDRPCGISVQEDIQSESTFSVFEGSSYNFSDTCHHLFVIANKISRALNDAKFSGKRIPIQTIMNFKNMISRVETQSAPHIQDVSACQNRDSCIEHYAFRTFADSIMLCLCRPAILSSHDNYNKELTDLYLSRCRSVLDTYLELLRLNCPIRRSWIFVHMTLSCALTLGLAPKGQDYDANKVLLKHFFEQLSQTTICNNVPAYENALKLIQDLVNGMDAETGAAQLEGNIYPHPGRF